MVRARNDSRIEPESTERNGLSHGLSEGIQVWHLAVSSRRGHGPSCGFAEKSRCGINAFARSADINWAKAIDRAGRDV
jgi:hypothetical protein